MITPKAPKLSPAERKRQEADAYAAVTNRDEQRCVRCRRYADPMSRDHRQGRGVGGRTLVENLQLLCGTGTTGCHGWKTLNPEAAISEGYTVPGRIADPAEWPARRWLPTQFGTVRQAWVLYDRIEDGGSFTEISESEAVERMGLAA